MIDVLGIDVGGTTTRVALFRTIDGRPHEVGRWSGPTRREDATRGIRDGIAALAVRHDVGEVRACGIGVPEYVDGGRVRSELVLRLGPSLGAALDPAAIGLPVGTALRIESDVRCGALAEWDALGDSTASAVYISLGTGLSSTLVLPGGTCWTGRTGGAISLGEWSSPVAGTTLEGFASGAGIEARHAAATGTATSTPRIVESAAAGDAAALRLLVDAGAAVGTAIRQLHAVIDPAFVILGGGLGVADGPLWDALRVAAADPIAGRSDVVLRRAALGERSGTIGAAIVAARSVGA